MSRSRSNHETQSLLRIVREALDYDSVTGILRWKEDRPTDHFLHDRDRKSWKTRVSGKIAGSVDSLGYIQVSMGVHGRRLNMRGHRLAWAIKTGSWPKDQIDHRNGIRTDNKWENLREASAGDNMQNTAHPGGKSGFVGVCPSGRKNQPWQMQIWAGDIKRLSRHSTREEAIAAYLSAKAELHKFQPIPRNMLADIQKP